MSAEQVSADSLSMRVREKARGLLDAPFFNSVADEIVLLQERLQRVEQLAMRQANRIRQLEREFDAEDES